MKRHLTSIIKKTATCLIESALEKSLATPLDWRRAWTKSESTKWKRWSDDEHERVRPKTPEPTKLDETDDYPLESKLTAESPLVETPPHFDDQEDGNVSDRISTGKVSGHSAQLSENEEDRVPSDNERDVCSKTPEQIDIEETSAHPLERKSSAESPLEGTPRQTIVSSHKELEEQTSTEHGETSGILAGLQMIIRQSLQSSDHDHLKRSTEHSETDETHEYPLASKLSAESPSMETSATFGQHQETDDDTAVHASPRRTSVSDHEKPEEKTVDKDHELAERRSSQTSEIEEAEDRTVSDQEEPASNSEQQSRKSSETVEHAAAPIFADHQRRSTDITEQSTKHDEEHWEQDYHPVVPTAEKNETQLKSPDQSETSTDPFALQSFQTYEAEHSDLSSNSQQIPVTFDQQVEADDPFSVEHKFSAEHLEREFALSSAHQDDDEYLTEETPSFSMLRSGRDHTDREQIIEEEEEDEEAPKEEPKLNTIADIVHSQPESEHEGEEDQAQRDHQDAMISTSRQSNDEDQPQPEHDRSTDHLVQTSSPTVELDQYELLSSIEPVQTSSYEEAETHMFEDDDKLENQQIERELSRDYILAETSPSAEDEETKATIEDQPVQSPEKSDESSFDKVDDEQAARRYSDEYEMVEQRNINVEYEDESNMESLPTAPLRTSESFELQPQEDEARSDDSEAKQHETPQDKLSTVKFVVASAASSEVEEEEEDERGEHEHHFLNESSGKTTEEDGHVHTEEYRSTTPQQQEEPEDDLDQSLDEPADQTEETLATHKSIEQEEKSVSLPSFPKTSDEGTEEHQLENQLLADTHAQLGAYQEKLQSLEQLSADHNDRLDVSETIEEETDQPATESSNLIEEKSFYDRPLSSAQVALSFTPSFEQGQGDETIIFDPSATIELQDDVPPEAKYSYQSPFNDDDDDDVVIASSLSDFERQASDENVIRIGSSSFDEPPPSSYLERSQSDDAYEMESPDSQKHIESRSPVTSHVQHASVISRTIGAYHDEEETEELEESDFRPTHLDISVADNTQRDLSNISTPEMEVVLSSPNATNEYEQILRETSHEMVNRILEDAFRETVEQEKNYVLHQTATHIVNDVIDSIYTKYDDELLASQREDTTSADASIGDLTDWSALVKGESDVTSPEKPTTTKSSDHEEEEEDDEDEEEEEPTAPISSQSASELNELLHELQALEEKIEDGHESDHDEALSDDEEKDQSFSRLTDQPHLLGNDVVSSNSTHELGDLAQELQTLEHQINDHTDLTRSSSPSSESSASENDDIHHYDLTVPQITTTTTSSELSNLVSELQSIEEQLEDKLETQQVEVIDPLAASSQSSNELGDVVSELQNVSEQMSDRLQQQQQEQRAEEVVQSSDVDTLTRDIIQYRRDSQSQSTEDQSHRTERRPSSPPGSPLLKQQFVQITCSSMNDVDQVQDQLRHEHEENQVLQDMINTVIREAQDNVQVDVSTELDAAMVTLFCSVLPVVGSSFGHSSIDSDDHSRPTPSLRCAIIGHEHFRWIGSLSWR